MNGLAVNDKAASSFYADEKLRVYLEKVLGFDLSRIDLNAVVTSLVRANGEYSSFDEFSAAVASQIAVHETYFLRHHEQFEWIEKFWLPTLLLKNAPTYIPIRILSAGCSTGEEPYSLYAHLFPQVEKYGIKLEIDAVDICEKALDTANKGRYGLWSLRGVNPDLEDTWLEVKSRNVAVKDWVREGVNFFRHNLTQPLSANFFQHYDLILCRNVMIYMHLEAVNKIYGNLFTALKSDGYLMPGPSDPSPMVMNNIQLSWENGVRLYTKTGHSISTVNMPYSAMTVTRQENETIELKKSVIETMKENNLTPPVKETIKRMDVAGKNDIRSKTSNEIGNYAIVDEMLRNAQYDNARKVLEANVAIDPLDVRSYVMLTVLALDLSDLKLAAHAARKALFLRPDAPYVVYLMANYKQKTGDFEVEKKELAIVKKQLGRFDAYALVEFCEEITIEELRGIVHARLS